MLWVPHTKFQESQKTGTKKKPICRARYHYHKVTKAMCVIWPFKTSSGNLRVKTAIQKHALEKTGLLSKRPHLKEPRFIIKKILDESVINSLSHERPGIRHTPRLNNPNMIMPCCAVLRVRRAHADVTPTTLCDLDAILLHYLLSTVD